MKKVAIFIIFFTLILMGCIEKEEGIEEGLGVEGGGFEMEENLTNVTVLVVYDNSEYDPNLELGFGFSCVVKTNNNTVLFDTGGDSPTLLANMEKMNIRAEEINIVVLSHIHFDHVGGLLGFLEENNKVKVYVPKSFPSSFKREIELKGATVVDVHESIEICDQVYTTGELETTIGLKEQSLVVNTDKGLVVISGCAHPGIVNILEKVKELFGKKIYLVLGGFHLGGKSETEIRGIIEGFKRLGVEKVAPCHCTGSKAIQMFQEAYGNNYIKNGVGRVIEV